jgi:hypothetical protein
MDFERLETIVYVPILKISGRSFSWEFRHAQLV